MIQLKNILKKCKNNDFHCSLNLYDYNRLDEAGKKKYIQSLMDLCHKNGGGRLSVPEGSWISGPIHMYSDCELHLCANSQVIFSDIPEDYLPVVFTRWEGIECYNYSPLIYGKDLSNVSITGSGKLVGNGQTWWSWKQKQQAAADILGSAQKNGLPVEDRIFGTREAALRPSFIQFINCSNVTLSDFTIADGPQWTIHPVYCSDVLISNVTIDTNGHNTDGINPDSCENVRIEGCNISTGDDCIAINSGMNEDGWRVNKPCHNITIVGCNMNRGHGAITIGSGMSGGVSDVHVRNCHVNGTMQGVRIKSMRGRGGYVKNVTVENVHMENVTEEGIQITMDYPFSTTVPLGDQPPVFENIELKYISGNAAKCPVLAKGLPDSPIKNLKFSNISIQAPGENIIENVE